MCWPLESAHVCVLVPSLRGASVRPCDRATIRIDVGAVRSTRRRYELPRARAHSRIAADRTVKFRMFNDRDKIRPLRDGQV